MWRTTSRAWLSWFLGGLLRAVQGADGLLANVLDKAQFWQRWAGTPMNPRQTLVLNRVLDGMEHRAQDHFPKACISAP